MQIRLLTFLILPFVSIALADDLEHLPEKEYKERHREPGRT